MKLVILTVMVLGVVGCSKKYDACVEKGVSYYKEIGSYPMLKSEGVSAEEKAEQLCKNSAAAFDF